MKKRPSKKSRQWFVRTRGSYLPSSPTGWLSYVPYITYLIGVTALAFHERYGFVTTVLILVPNWVAAAVIMNWLAANHS